MRQYLGGYYLMKLRPIKFGTLTDSIIYTCSDCINDNLIESWAYTWTTNNNDQIEAIKNDYSIDDDSVFSIRSWVDEKFEENLIGWPDIFVDIETAVAYKQNFFSHLTDIKLFALYFNETEAERILQEFKPKSEKEGESGLYKMLSKRIVDKDNMNETLIGFDIIGIENGGDFHSFHCHDIGQELLDKFGFTFNKYGLIEQCNDWTPLLDYFNDDENGCEPVPWFLAMTKLINNE
jgi:hypothetical protein